MPASTTSAEFWDGEVVGHCALFLWFSEEAFTVVPLEAQQVRIVSWI